MNYFEPKDSTFKSRKFLKDVKHLFLDCINELLPEDQKMAVFDSSGPYLVTKKIGKNNPKADVLRADNKKRQEWNQTVDDAMLVSIPVEQIQAVKREMIIKSVANSVRSEGEKPELFSDILSKAISILM